MSSLYLQVCVPDLSKTDFMVSLISQHFFACSVHLVSQKWNLSLIPVFPSYLASNPQKILVLLEKHAPESTHFSCLDQRCFLLQDPPCRQGWKGEWKYRDFYTDITMLPTLSLGPGGWTEGNMIPLLPHSLKMKQLPILPLLTNSFIPLLCSILPLFSLLASHFLYALWICPTFMLSFSLFLAFL